MLYDFLGREDINWRGLTSELARRVYQGNDLGPRSQCAFVVDDTTQARAGRKVEGSSCYFDHTQGRTRKGHQVPHLGLAGEKGFLPLEAQIVMGEKCRGEKPNNKSFKDQRSAAARATLPLGKGPAGIQRSGAGHLGRHGGRLPLHERRTERRQNPGSLRVALVHRSLLQRNQTEPGVLKGAERTLPVGVRLRAFGRPTLSSPVRGNAAGGPVELRGNPRPAERAMQTLTYAALLWQLFRALIEGALEGLVRDLGRKVIKKVLAAIDQTVEGFLNEALQISPEQVAVQLKAEELGYL